MVWMATTAERRAAPRALWPEVRSVIMLGMNYGPDEDPLAILTRKDRARDLGLRQGRRLSRADQGAAQSKSRAGWSANAGGDVKVFVDTAAVMEKPLAAKAGLGWQGKHTNLVSREFGSWLFLGSIFTTLDLPADAARAGQLRQLPRLSRYLPDRGVSRALPARCAALHFVSHHRAQRPDPARVARSDGQPHLWLRRLSRGLPVEQVRGRRPRSQARRARELARAQRSPSLRASTTRNSARCLPRPRSSAPAATASCAMC